MCHIKLAKTFWTHDMSVIERTSAGLQTAIPGCERRTLPKSTTRVDDNGQGLLHFYKPSSLREQLARRVDAPLLPRRGQKPLPKSGFLFFEAGCLAYLCRFSVARPHTKPKTAKTATRH